MFFVCRRGFARDGDLPGIEHGIHRLEDIVFEKAKEG